MADRTNRVTRRRFLRRASQAAIGGPMLLGAYVWRIEPHWVQVVHRSLPIARLPLPLEGKTIAHISDLHIGPVVDNAYLRSAMRRVMLNDPVAVVVTGDWMTCDGNEQVSKAIDTARELRPGQTPVIAILGNHDYAQNFRTSSVADELSEGLQKVGVRVLRNDCTDLRGLQFAGTDDLWSRRCRVRETLSQLDPQQAAVALTHNPDTLDRHGWDGYRGWVLAGHTHGGQCWVPGVGAPVLPVRNKRYVGGEVGLADGRRLYINRGLGYKRRVRLMSRPEITLFRLTRDEQAV